MISYDAVQFISGLIAFVIVGMSLLYLLRETWWRQFVEDVRNQSYDEGWDAAVAYMQGKQQDKNPESNEKESSHA